MKNYFIANNEVLDTDMTIEEIEKRVQETLDESTSGFARFKIQEMGRNKVKMLFIRDFVYTSNEQIIYDTDMNLITNIGIPAFQLKEVGGYPLVYPLKFAGKNFYTSITAFLRFYKYTLFMQLGQQVEDISIRCYSDRIAFQIVY